MDELETILKKTAHTQLKSIPQDVTLTYEDIAGVLPTLPFESTKATQFKWRCVDLASSNTQLPFFNLSLFEKLGYSPQEHFIKTLQKQNPTLSPEQISHMAQTATPHQQRSYIHHFYDLEHRMTGPLEYRQGLPEFLLTKLQRLHTYLSFDRLAVTEMQATGEMVFHSQFDFNFMPFETTYSHLAVHLPLVTNSECYSDVLFSDGTLQRKHYPVDQFWACNSWQQHRDVNWGTSSWLGLLLFINIKKNETLLQREFARPIQSKLRA